MKIMKSKVIGFFFLLITPSLALPAEDKSQEILFKAVNKNDVAGANQVLAWGADVNQKDVFGRTLLMIAAANGYLQMVKLLLDEGALINEINGKGQTALDIAKEKGNVAVIKVIEDFMAKKRKKRRKETSEAILKSRPEVYPVIAEEIAELEIGK